MGGVPGLGLCDLNDRWPHPSVVHIVNDHHGAPKHADAKVRRAETSVHRQSA